MVMFTHMFLLLWSIEERPTHVLATIKHMHKNIALKYTTFWYAIETYIVVPGDHLFLISGQLNYQKTFIAIPNVYC